ncbi:MAG TPA: hypothetical protein VN668_03945, partial [Stellaceae bacterium]|nr:hypothetical protein [Stellaceae bacterium]
MLVRVGYDESGDKIYSIMAGLSPQPPGELEYVFALIEADAETDTERAIFDSQEVAAMISQDDRAKVMAAVLAATQLLIDQVKPQYFVMATRDGYLPPRALEKYEKIHHLFIESGYSVTATN